MKTNIILPQEICAKKLSSKRIFLLIVMLIITAGILCALTIPDYSYNQSIPSALSLLFFTSVTILIFVACTLTHTVLKESGHPFIYKTIGLWESQFSNAKQAIATNNLAEIEQSSDQGNGAAMKLEIIYTKDKNFAVYQFFRYVNYSYEPHSELFYIEKAKISKLIHTKK